MEFKIIVLTVDQNCVKLLLTIKNIFPQRIQSVFILNHIIVLFEALI